MMACGQCSLNRAARFSAGGSSGFALDFLVRGLLAGGAAMSAGMGAGGAREELAEVGIGGVDTQASKSPFLLRFSRPMVRE